MAYKKYDLARIKFMDVAIWVKDFTVEDNITVEKYKPCDEKYPVDGNTTEHDISCSLEEVHPKYRDFFDSIVFMQDEAGYKPPTVDCYDYGGEGDLVEKTKLYGVFIEKFGKETENKPFSVDMTAFSRKNYYKGVVAPVPTD